MIRTLAALVFAALMPTAAFAGTIAVHAFHEPGTNFVHLSFTPSQDLIHFNLLVTGGLEFQAPAGVPPGGGDSVVPGTAVGPGALAALPPYRTDVPATANQFGTTSGLHPSHELFIFPTVGFLEFFQGIPMAVGGQETYLGRVTAVQDPATDPDFAIYSACDLGGGDPSLGCGIFVDDSVLYAGDLVGDVRAPPADYHFPFGPPNVAPGPGTDPIPEPGSLALFALGGLIVAGAVRRYGS